MASAREILEAQQRLAAAGLAASDLGWLQARQWSDADIPPIGSDAEDEAYARREERLNASIADLGITERGASLESRLAAAIGARRADWRERNEKDEDG